jgi:hypothetical protein
MQRQGGLSIETMCSLGEVSRSAFYRYLSERPAKKTGATDS